MKINKILDRLQEKWYKETISSHNNDYREIFINPSINDILDIEKYGGTRSDRLRTNDVRFIADISKKNVYVTSADVFHNDIINEVSELRGFPNDYFSGMGEIRKSGSIHITDISDYLLDFEHKDDLIKQFRLILEGKYDWMERYHFELGNIKIMASDYLDSL